MLDLAFVLQIRECRQEKFEQLNFLKRICDNMGSLNLTDLNLNTSFTQLEDTIKTLNQTAHAEDIELEKEEEEVAKLVTSKFREIRFQEQKVPGQK